jgi:hypothetical protein
VNEPGTLRRTIGAARATEERTMTTEVARIRETMTNARAEARRMEATNAGMGAAEWRAVDRATRNGEAEALVFLLDAEGTADTGYGACVHAPEDWNDKSAEERTSFASAAVALARATAHRSGHRAGLAPLSAAAGVASDYPDPATGIGARLDARRMLRVVWEAADGEERRVIRAVAEEALGTLTASTGAVDGETAYVGPAKRGRTERAAEPWAHDAHRSRARIRRQRGDPRTALPYGARGRIAARLGVSGPTATRRLAALRETFAPKRAALLLSAALRARVERIAARERAAARATPNRDKARTRAVTA